jgi:hypothetical protein
MAIYFPTEKAFNFTPAPAQRGWIEMTGARGIVNTMQASMMLRGQPGALSRPGNLGTAYTGVWTENVTGAADSHRPIPFELAPVSAGSLLPRPSQIRQLSHL